MLILLTAPLPPVLFFLLLFTVNTVYTINTAFFDLREIVKNLLINTIVVVDYVCCEGKFVEYYLLPTCTYLPVPVCTYFDGFVLLCFVDTFIITAAKATRATATAILTIVHYYIVRYYMYSEASGRVGGS